jgi:hypothetical protein
MCGVLACAVLALPPTALVFQLRLTGVNASVSGNALAMSALRAAVLQHVNATGATRLEAGTIGSIFVSAAANALVLAPCLFQPLNTPSVVVATAAQLTLMLVCSNATVNDVFTRLE